MATTVKAHIAGTVWKIEVAVGDAVAEGQTVVILESMKMEMPVESPEAGRVSALHVAPRDAVEEGGPPGELERQPQIGADKGPPPHAHRPPRRGPRPPPGGPQKP